jgi:hypothetical protein
MLASPFEVSVVGVTFRGAAYPQNIFEIASHIGVAERPLRADLVREPDNPVDSKALQVAYRGTHIGYLPKAIAASLSDEIDAGAQWFAIIDRIIVSPENPEQPGIRLRVFRRELERQTG